MWTICASVETLDGHGIAQAAHVLAPSHRGAARHISATRPGPRRRGKRKQNTRERNLFLRGSFSRGEILRAMLSPLRSDAYIPYGPIATMSRLDAGDLSGHGCSVWARVFCVGTGVLCGHECSVWTRAFCLGAGVLSGEGHVATCRLIPLPKRKPRLHEFRTRDLSIPSPRRCRCATLARQTADENVFPAVRRMIRSSGDEQCMGTDYNIQYSSHQRPLNLMKLRPRAAGKQYH